MEENPFNVVSHMNDLQKNEEVRDALSNGKSSDSIASKEKLSQATAGWVPKVGDLVREEIPDKAVFSQAYRDHVPVLGLKGTRTVILPPLPGTRKKHQVSNDNVKPT